jgi:hypothetical protein
VDASDTLMDAFCKWVVVSKVPLPTLEDMGLAYDHPEVEDRERACMTARVCACVAQWGGGLGWVSLVRAWVFGSGASPSAVLGCSAACGHALASLKDEEASAWLMATVDLLAVREVTMTCLEKALPWIALVAGHVGSSPSLIMWNAAVTARGAAVSVDQALEWVPSSLASALHEAGAARLLQVGLARVEALMSRPTLGAVLLHAVHPCLTQSTEPSFVSALLPQIHAQWEAAGRSRL